MANTPSTGVLIPQLEPYILPEILSDDDLLVVVDVSDNDQARRIVVSDLISSSQKTFLDGLLQNTFVVTPPLTLSGPVAGPGSNEQTITLGANTITEYGDGITSTPFAAPATLVAGTNVTFGFASNELTINAGSPGISGIEAQDDGFSIKTDVDTLNFTGAGVTVSSGAGNAVNIDITGTGSPSIAVQDEGGALTTLATTLNFVGGGVTATGSGVVKTISVSGDPVEVVDDVTSLTTNLTKLTFKGTGFTITQPSPGEIEITFS